MSNILQFIRPTSSFDPETLIVLGSAYDRARRSLGNSTSVETAQEIIASRIIDAAMNGERDPDILCQIAVHGFRPPI